MSTTPHTIRFAVVGNPNVGKTTLFNALTGLSQVTGNYPGVTVERKVGKVRRNGHTAELIDLPGTYSLAARSPDEMIVVDVLLGQQEGEQPIDAILAVVDASNIERNLYLISQLLELSKPVVVALNMCDIAEKRNIVIDQGVLERELGARVLTVCASRRIGIDQLKAALADPLSHESRIAPAGALPPSLLDGIASLEKDLKPHEETLGRPVHRAEVLRLLVDRGGYAEQRLSLSVPDATNSLLEPHRRQLTSEGNGSLAALEARSRYAWIRKVVEAGVHKPATRVITFSDKLDAVLTHKFWGTVVFILLMGLIFQAIYAWASPAMNAMDAAIGGLGGYAESLIPEGALQSLVVDGIIAGVGSVLIFLPQIVILMLFVAMLEDCGYMARAAFLMDRLLSRCGLSGQSFIPMLSSFACAIPGIMATRTIGNRRDRLTTILVAPLMSCSARLPVYTLMIAAFIPNTTVLGGFVRLQAITLFCMYLVGIIVAIPVAWIVKGTILRGETPPFLMELPTYKWPQPRTIARKVYIQGREFIRRAGTVIFAISVIVWALAYFPHSSSVTEKFDLERQELNGVALDDTARESALAEIDSRESGEHLQNSIFGRMGRIVEPVVAPLGWDWRIGMAAIASFPAREVVVATMGTIFNLGDEVDETSAELTAVLQNAERVDGTPLFNVPVALSLMVFFALCAQCGATLAIIRRETGSIRWPILTFTYMTGIAYVASCATFQITSWLGWGGA